MVLGGEDVARAPADVGAESDEGLDEDRGLDGHVQRAHDPDALEGLSRGVLLADRHEAGHLVLGDVDLLATEVGKGDVGDWWEEREKRERERSVRIRMFEGGQRRSQTKCVGVGWVGSGRVGSGVHRRRHGPAHDDHHHKKRSSQPLLVTNANGFICVCVCVCVCVIALQDIPL